MIVQMKRIIFLLWIFCLSVQAVFSQSHVSKNNYTGDWTTSTSWSPTWSSPQTNNLTSDITINGYITLNGSLSFSILPCNLIINDTLVINGDLTLGLLTDLTINGNGILIVRGNLTIGAFSSIITNNYIVITGDVLKLGSTNTGSFISNDNPEKVFIGGDISPTGINRSISRISLRSIAQHQLQPDIRHSNCSYGDMTDIINDPIYPFFQSTCTIAAPTITAGGPTTFCAGGSVTLTSSAGTSYLWSNGATTRSINVTASGSYTVRVTNSGGCQSTLISNSSYCQSFTGNTNNNRGWSNDFLCRRKCNFNIKCRNKLLMVKWSNYFQYNCYYSRKLYCKSNKCKRMSEYSISSYNSNSKFITVNSNNYCRRSNNFLCRWKCNFNLKCRFNLLMVNRSNHTKYKCYLIRKLYCKGNKCKRMSECTISSHCSNCKCFTCDTNNYSQWSNNLLCRRQCNLNIKCRHKLLMVKWSNYIKYKCYQFRKLYCSS